MSNTFKPKKNNYNNNYNNNFKHKKYKNFQKPISNTFTNTQKPFKEFQKPFEEPPKEIDEYLTEDEFNQLVLNKSFQEANKIALSCGATLRIVKENGNLLFVDANNVENRANVVVTKGIVNKIVSWY